MQNGDVYQPLSPEERESVSGVSPIVSLWTSYALLVEVNEWLARRLREVNERWAELHAPFPQVPQFPGASQIGANDNADV